MATPFLKVYDAFLARITADEWTLEEELAIVERDWQQLLLMAIDRFAYPRVSLDIDEVEPVDANDQQAPGIKMMQFTEDLTNAEIQMLAVYMKHEWIKRCIADYREIGSLYTSKDFSQANHLDKLLKLEQRIELEVAHAEGRYDRSRNKSPAEIFRRLAGKKRYRSNV